MRFRLFSVHTNIVLIALAQHGNNISPISEHYAIFQCKQILIPIQRAPASSPPLLSQFVKEGASGGTMVGSPGDCVASAIAHFSRSVRNQKNTPVPKHRGASYLFTLGKQFQITWSTVPSASAGVRNEPLQLLRKLRTGVLRVRGIRGSDVRNVLRSSAVRGSRPWVPCCPW